MPASKAISVASALRRPERTTEKVARASTSVPNAVAADAAVSQLMEATVAHPFIDVSCHRWPEIEDPLPPSPRQIELGRPEPGRP